MDGMGLQLRKYETLALYVPRRVSAVDAGSVVGRRGFGEKGALLCIRDVAGVGYVSVRDARMGVGRGIDEGLGILLRVG